MTGSSTDLPTAGVMVGREHRLPVRIYYEDTDFTGMVYHANYVRYFERGRSDFLRLVGVSHSDLLVGAEPAAFVVTRLDIRFQKPGRSDDALVVVTTYDQVKGPRLFLSQRIERGGEILATASIEAACIRLDGRPCKPPPGLTKALMPWFLPNLP
jgi:acyl-CoA thioester hydrolase